MTDDTDTNRTETGTPAPSCARSLPLLFLEDRIKLRQLEDGHETNTGQNSGHFDPTPQPETPTHTHSMNQKPNPKEKIPTPPQKIANTSTTYTSTVLGGGEVKQLENSSADPCNKTRHDHQTTPIRAQLVAKKRKNNEAKK